MQGGEVFRPVLSAPPAIHPPAGWLDLVGAEAGDISSSSATMLPVEDLNVRIMTASGSPPRTPQVLDSRLADCLANAGRGPSEEVFRADNAGLQAATAGLGLRNSMSLADMDQEGKLVTWGSLVCGLSIDGNWVKVGRQFLPKRLNGAQVLFPTQQHDEDTVADTLVSPLSDATTATTVPDGYPRASRYRRERLASSCSRSQSARNLERSSATIEKECQDLKAQLHVARERLARLQDPTAMELKESEPFDIRDQTIEHLQKKLRSERQLAEAARQELIQKFARERELLNRELCLERSRRQHYQQLVEAQRVSDAEAAAQAFRVQLPMSTHRASSNSSRSHQIQRQPSLASAAARVLPTSGRRDFVRSRSLPHLGQQPPARFTTRDSALQVDASSARGLADNLSSPMRYRGSSGSPNGLRVASPSNEAGPIVYSRSISRGSTRLTSSPLPQPCSVQPSAIVYKHSQPTSTSFMRSQVTTAREGEWLSQLGERHESEGLAALRKLDALISR